LSAQWLRGKLRLRIVSGESGGSDNEQNKQDRELGMGRKITRRDFLTESVSLSDFTGGGCKMAARL